ncbi:uncharacterized protein V6R79_002896 [Siganus canaliculatus]
MCAHSWRWSRRCGSGGRRKQSATIRTASEQHLVSLSVCLASEAASGYFCVLSEGAFRYLSREEESLAPVFVVAKEALRCSPEGRSQRSQWFDLLVENNTCPTLTRSHRYFLYLLYE